MYVCVCTSTVHHFGLLDSSGEHAQRIVQRALGFIDDLLRGATDHYRARRAELHARETDEALISNQHLRTKYYSKSQRKLVSSDNEYRP